MVTVRSATSTDLPALAALWYERIVLLGQADPRFALAEPGARDRWLAQAERWMTDAACALLVAADEGKPPSGYITAWIQNAPPGLTFDRYGLITDLALDAHRYQPGAGRALVAALRERFAALGVVQLAAWVAHRSPVEQAFWRALGATEWMDVFWLKP